MKNILICGLGAIGCIYADKFNQSKDFNLKILVDKNRLIKYTKFPRTLNNKQLNLQYVLPDETNFSADLIIIATKSSGLDFAVRSIENFVTENSIILSLINGITSEQILSVKYGTQRIIQSYYIGHSAIRMDNNIIHDGVATIVFGKKNNSDKSIFELKKIFDTAQISYEISNDIDYSLWLKFMLNVGLNQVSAIYNLTVGELLRNKKALNLAKNLMSEVQQIAEKEGIINSENMPGNCMNSINKINPDGKTSMLQDILAKRKPETDIFADVVIHLGQKHKIKTPYNQYIKEQLEKL